MTDTVVAFDTLAYARKLKAAGVDGAQAEAHAEAIRDSLMQGLATKADIRELRADIVAIKWVLGFLSIFVLAMAARLFGVV